MCSGWLDLGVGPGSQHGSGFGGSGLSKMRLTRSGIPDFMLSSKRLTPAKNTRASGGFFGPRVFRLGHCKNGPGRYAGAHKRQWCAMILQRCRSVRRQAPGRDREALVFRSRDGRSCPGCSRQHAPPQTVCKSRGHVEAHVARPRCNRR